MKDHENGLLVGYQTWERWFFGVLCLSVVSVFFLPLYVGWGPPALMAYFYLGLCLILTFPLKLLYQSFDHLCLYWEGIEIHKILSHTQFLSWEEISEIRGSLWSSDLIVSNSRGNKSFRVNSAYENSLLLLELLVSIRPDLFQSIKPLTLSMSPLISVFFGITLILLTVFGFNGVFMGRNGILLLVLLLLCLVILFLAFLVIPYSILIIGDQLVLRYPFRTTVIKAVDVSHISKTTRFDFIYEWGEVTIHLRRNASIVLMFYNLGVSLLYAFLASWLQVASTPRLEAGILPDIGPDQRNLKIVHRLPYRLHGDYQE